MDRHSGAAAGEPPVPTWLPASLYEAPVQTKALPLAETGRDPNQGHICTQGATQAQLYAAIQGAYTLCRPPEGLISPTGGRLWIKWEWPPAEEQGAADVMLMSAEEVASQLSELRYHQRRVLCPVRDPELFWSCIFNWHRHGTCCPVAVFDAPTLKVPSPPSHKAPRNLNTNPRITRLKSKLSVHHPDKPPPAKGNYNIPGPVSPLVPEWLAAIKECDKAFRTAARKTAQIKWRFFSKQTGWLVENSGGCQKVQRDIKFAFHQVPDIFTPRGNY